MIHSLVVSLGAAVTIAGVLAISTVGFTLRYAVSGVFDLTYGALMGFAMLVAYLLAQVGVNLWLAVLIAGACVAVLSVVLERAVVRPMVTRGATSWVMMIVTFAIGLAIEAAILGTWGPGFNSYAVSGRTFHIGSVVVTTYQLWTLAIAAFGTIAVGLLLRFTQLGRAMRATATNPGLAANCGIKVQVVRSIAWFSSGLLCGAGGVLVAVQIGSFMYSSWEQFFPLVIAAAIVGGVGRPAGAFAGALLIGLVTALSAALLSSAYEDVIALGLLVVVLLLRPQGLISSIA